MTALFVPVATDVYSDIDRERAVGSIARVGGGQYVFVAGDGSAKQTHPDHDAAKAAATTFVASIEKPGASGDTLALAKAQATINDLLAKIAELQRQLDAKAQSVLGAVSADPGDAKA